MTAPAPDHGGRAPAGVMRVALAVMGGVLLMALMGLTVVDVVGRYIFDAPLIGATELTELLLAAVIFLGLPAVALAEEHVSVDLLTDRMPPWVQPWRLALAGVFSGVVLGLVTWRIWIYAGQIGAYGGLTNSLRLPIAPLGYFCAVCTGLGAVITALMPLARLRRRG
ncbi:C4-dicarboxylate ABC transporter substrate-binding protein [Salipiger aestuarii]|uniref:TRAP transporter small permease protein n=1 Tax=Salipiger aestuarii TaxID=568098 RepID=A0A327XT91_9RHOB|nr:TRAP transporter small permease [Salipiger aestuarii]EIE52443.1 tripartite ATP-independent periplasmic (TRAP) C4-dicarboxylate transporter subunit DctQ [Citreicella sp. 357]KAA8605814.1 C4-dicarboxylate ABC transporter substrate-binding protein [Salipiger aestuarii]KAA8608499.1 C4-dicarboxylate ABC transporter substrate-binding protein [Salipiger aestuarii]KAB2540591.1 C4-dicarboxylate ABC transporter substrate-binding protein [Salipiger aestuarii]RAK11287.1 TRAP-type C4-dicarboxylate trans